MLKDGSSELVSISMQRWEKKLSSAQFARVHRSAIASISSIQRVHRKGGRWQAWLNGLSDPIPVNRDVARRLRAEGRFEKVVTGR
jgi:DNA-binding LytR/AlgR family response regulator